MGESCECDVCPCRQSAHDWDPGTRGSCEARAGVWGSELCWTSASLITPDLTLTGAFSFLTSNKREERPWESVYKLDLSRQTSLLLRDWRSEERWVSDSDFIATNSHKTAQPHSKLTIHFYWHTQKETASINKPIYDSLVLRFWFISDKNK